jgi:hypothetical protein
MQSIPFETVIWNSVPKTEHKGEVGMAYWQTIQLDGLRIRVVEYSPGYIADHWCTKGHIIYCIEGEMVSELKDGSKNILRKGMSYHVTDDNDNPHRSITSNGCKLFIIDGNFLNPTS